MDASTKSRGGKENGVMTSMNSLSTINRVLVHRYTKASAFVHDSVIQGGIYNV